MNFGSHLSGPVQQKDQKKNQSARAWFGKQPVGSNDPDYVNYLVDYTKATDYSTSDWTLTLVGTGTAAVGTSTNTNGILTLATTNGGTDSNNLQAQNLSWLLDNTTIATNHAVTAIPKSLWFEAAISVSSVADVDAFVGLSIAATDVFSSASYIGFRITNGSGNIACVNALASSASSITVAQGNGNTPSVAAGTQVKLGIRYNGANAVDFYINRNFIGTQTANLPVNLPLALTAKVKANSANVRSMAIDYLYACKVR